MQVLPGTEKELAKNLVVIVMCDALSVQIMTSPNPHFSPK